MKKVLLICFLSVFMFFPFNVFAAVYFVAQEGAGNGSGSSYQNRAGVNTHNAGTGYFGDLDGDTVVLCGSISTPVKVYDGGLSGKNVTYDGDASAYDAGAIDAEITGYSSGAGNSGFYMYGKEYVTVKNLKIDFNYSSEMGSTMDNIFGLRIQNSNDIVIDNVYIEKTHNGIGIHDDSYNIEIIRSKIEEIAESGIYISNYSTYETPHDIIIGGSPTNGNTIKNCTYKTKWDNNRVGYDIRLGLRVENITISYNHLYADLPYHGMSGVLVHSSKNILIEYNTIHDHQSYNHRPAISVKGELSSQLASNIVIRHNKIYNEKSDANAYTKYASALVFSGNWEHVYVYGNHISYCGGGISVNFANWISPATHSDGIDPNNMHIWSNEIIETSDYGISVSGTSTGTDTIYDVFILNNTLYRVAKSADYSTWAGIGNRLSSSQVDNLLIKNNIIMDSRIENADKFSIYSTQRGNIFIENNHSYYSDITDYVELELYFSETDNPLFSNPENEVFTLLLDSPCEDSGLTMLGPTSVPASVVSLAGIFNYSYALDPVKTDWTTIPPRVYMLKQTDYGAGWENGAYVYYSISLSKPTNPMTKPTDFRVVISN